MKKLLICCFIGTLFSVSTFADRGDYIADTLVDQYNEALLGLIWGQIPDLIQENVPCAEWSVPSIYEVDMYKLVYETVNAYGETTIASGLLGIPVGSDCNLPMLNYNHGTSDGGVLSAPGTIADLLGGDLAEWFISVPIATAGYIAIMPDYIGYGQSKCTDYHAYNNYNQAKDVVDMIRATKEFCDIKGIAYSDELFLTGYSEGGHVAMATAKEIQENHCDEIHVTAAAPLSGAHSVFPLTRDTLLAPSYNNITNLTYFIYSQANLCPDIVGEEGLAAAVLPEYVDNIYAAWDECDTVEVGDFEWPSPAAAILKPEYVADVIANPCHPFNESIRRGNLNNWVPNIPMRLYYVESDEQVPYTNSTTTAAWMAAQGADVTAHTIEACAGIIHSEFAVPSLMETLEWFTTMTSTECDFQAELDPDFCSTAEPFNACPGDGVSTPFVNFVINDDDIIFETLEYNDDCEIAVENTVNSNSTQEILVTMADGEVFNLDTFEMITNYDTIFAATPITTDDYVLTYTVLDTSELVYVYDTTDITGINTIMANGLEVELLANPVAYNLVLDITNEIGVQNANIAIYDINGRTINSELIQLGTNIQYQKEVGNLATGVYFLQVQLPDGTSNTIRFVKN